MTIPATHTPATDLRRINLAAAQIGVSKPTIYRAAKAGFITLVKRPGMTFVSMSQLQEWIAAGEQRGPNWGAGGDAKN